MPSVLPILALAALSSNPTPPQDVAPKATPEAGKSAARRGEWVPLENGARYRVVNVERSATYKMRHDQGGGTVKASLGDQLAVVDFEVHNGGNDNVSLPGVLIEAVDDEGIICPAGVFDLRQRSHILTAEGTSVLGGVSPTVQLAEGGKTKFAVVFAIGAGRQIARVRIRRYEQPALGGSNRPTIGKWFDINP